MTPPPNGAKEMKFLAKVTEQRPGAFLGSVVASVDDRKAVTHSKLNSHGAAQLEWREDVKFINPCSLISLAITDTKAELYRLLDRYNLLSLARTLDNARRAQQPRRDHLVKYQKWLEHTVADLVSGSLECPGVPNAQNLVTMTAEQRDEQPRSIFKQLQGTEVDAPATAIHRVSSHCEGIFNKDSSEVEILLADGVLQHVYDCLVLDTEASAFFSLIGHKKPNLRVLEIGAGTRGATAGTLRGLTSAQGERMYQSYTYTDISPGFFADAKARFKEYSGLEFALLHVSKDPLEQGFNAESYDLIIAWNVIHATPDMHQSLANIRKLIPLQGWFLLQEIALLTPWINHCVGVIPGWWLGEANGRASAPHVDLDRWKNELTESGFRDVSNTYDGYANNNIVCRPAPPRSRPKRVTLLKRLTGPSQFGETVLLEYAPLLGVARVLRTKLELNFANLKLDSFSRAGTAEVIQKVFSEFKQRILDDPDANPEYEWAYTYGKLLVSFYRHVKVEQKSHELQADMTVRKLEQRKPGLTDTFCWKALAPQKLNDGEVRIDVKAIGINYKDVLILNAAARGLPTEPTYKALKLRHDRSYLFTGGLGSLGQVISTWLAEKGAKEIIFLSRSAGSLPEHATIVEELSALGCKATIVSGDVAMYEDVARALESATMPVGGVLHSAMTLRDAGFLGMSWANKLTASQPKIDGTTNLHEALLKQQPDVPADFFLLFSSTAATGGWWGQANYHAGN
ncbi:Highly reducing polyketide synthase gloL, partial [Colletotrichum shisoi]